jgi:hypothetical protein
MAWAPVAVASRSRGEAPTAPSSARAWTAAYRFDNRPTASTCPFGQWPETWARVPVRPSQREKLAGEIAGLQPLDVEQLKGRSDSL